VTKRVKPVGAGLRRRELLIAAGAGAGALLLGPDARAADPKPEIDVLVVGGGFAGVTAARDCALRGYRTVLLEARERLGGRTFTSELGGHSIELGGTWVHWAQPYVWAEIQRYGLAVAETPELGLDLANEELIALVGGKRVVVGAQDMAAVQAALEAYFGPARLVWNRPYDSRFAQAELAKLDALSALDALSRLELSPLQRGFLEGYLLSMTNGPLDRVAYTEMLRWWALGGWNLPGVSDAVARYKLADGTKALIAKMAEHGRFEVRLGAIASRIESSETGVRVRLAGGAQLDARAAVITLPLNVLPGVEFAPALDARLLELAGLRHGGRGFKLYIRTKGRATKHKKASAVAPATHPLSYALTYAIDDASTLFVAFGADPDKLDVSDRNAVQGALRAWFPGVEVESISAWSWSSDPYARGTWATLPPGWVARWAEALERDRGRLFFASGDVGEGWRGFIDGAIGAGSRAAVRVHGRLG
jgi:monoamine oxidase